MTANLQNPIFTDETKAREWLEARVWPNGPVCPHCGNADHAKLKALQGKAHRPGLYQCADCREQSILSGQAGDPLWEDAWVMLRCGVPGEAA